MNKPIVLDPTKIMSCSEEEYQAAREFGSDAEHFAGMTLRGGYEYQGSFYFTGRSSEGHKKIHLYDTRERRK